MNSFVDEDYPFDLGKYRRTNIKTSGTNADAAQVWSNRGLVWCFCFHFEEATKCFKKALEADPGCAFAHWGISYASGTNYNQPEIEEENYLIAYQSAKKAEEFKSNGSPIEQALIDAIQYRYAPSMPADLTPFNVAYYNALVKVYKEYPDDLDVAFLFADSIMNIRPWKLWTKDGKPEPQTDELIEVLETALAKQIDHPGLGHLYIHAVEMSPYLEKSLTVCKILHTTVPHSGHLIHMPSHIYIQLGQYDQCVKSNLAAQEADKVYVKREGVLNFYTLYRVHNVHFVVYAGMLAGQYKIAALAAQHITEELTTDVVSFLPDWLETFVGIPFHVMIRFGKWEDILQTPLPENKELYASTVALAHYARGVAYAALDRIEEAENEKKLFQETYERVPETRKIFHNTARSLLTIASAMLNGEIEYRKKNYDSAFVYLNEAVTLDDNLNYDEPWGWMQPARHALGALLLEQDRLAEAEAVYREDLKKRVENCWSLHGLAEILRKTNRTSEAEEIEKRLNEAQKYTDVPIKASCFCRLSAYKN